MENKIPTIIFESDEYLILNKPAGLMVHPDGRSTEPTLCDWLLKHFPKLQGVGEPLTLSSGAVIDRPGIVHRLDRDTSGALIAAKNQESFLLLKNQFQMHEVEKTYHALVYGTLKEKKAVIDRPIARSRSDFRLWSAQRGARGEARSAVTHYEVLEERPGFSFLAASPKTGRTHQLRVHFKAINHPIVCDRLYAPKQPCAFGLGRTALHAFEIGFKDKEGKSISVQAPYPNDFKEALQLFRALPVD